jgi:hypothetical protein
MRFSISRARRRLIRRLGKPQAQPNIGRARKENRLMWGCASLSQPMLAEIPVRAEFWFHV